MGSYAQFGKLTLNPAENPGVLDTGTWDPANAWALIQAPDDAYWRRLQEAASAGSDLPPAGALTPFANSYAVLDDTMYCLAGLPDAQQVLLSAGAAPGTPVLGEPVAGKTLAGGGWLAMYPTEAATLDRFFRRVSPRRGPRALGAAPRLGIGTRMTTAVWPAIWRAMDQAGFAANAIQNSVRELNLLSQLTAGLPPDKNVAFGFGTIESGYTGSTFEGLWVAGAIDALQNGAPSRYGADADHIQVKRGPDGMARARRVAAATRYYSFFTLDVSDVLDYAALSEDGVAAAEAQLAENIPVPGLRREVLAYHRASRRVGGQTYCPDDAMLGRLVGKYWTALTAVEELYRYLAQLKDGQPFDLELSIDEHPGEVATFDCLTAEVELLFVILEARRRGIPLTHVAPNFGVEKGTDYRCPDGLSGLEARCRSLGQIADDTGIMLDFHSGDDLSQATRRVIRRATGGRHHFKVSPMLQLLFAEVLNEHHPDLFLRWWADALAYAEREAAAGSAFAAGCILEARAGHEDAPGRIPQPSPMDSIFHHFSFAFPGRRDADGQFLHRQEFYTLSPAFYRAYSDRLVSYLCGLAEDLF